MNKIASELYRLASQENCDGEPWDQMQAGADCITRLESELTELRSRFTRLDQPKYSGDPMLDSVLAESNPDFRAWVESLPPTYWARYDLSAARIGWEAARKAGERELAEARAAIESIHPTKRGTIPEMCADIGEGLEVVRLALNHCAEQRDTTQSRLESNMESVAKLLSIRDSLQGEVSQLTEQRDRLAEAVRQHKIALEDSPRKSEHDMRLWERALAAEEGGKP